MKNEISKTRLKKVGNRERHFLAGFEQVSFRNGTVLAIFYAFLLMLGTLGCSYWCLEATSHAVSGIQFPQAFVASLLAVFTTRTLLKAISRDLLRRNSRILMFCIVALFYVALSALCVVVSDAPILERWLDFKFHRIAPALFPTLLVPALCALLSNTSAGIAAGVGCVFLSIIFAPREQMLPTFAVGILISVVMPPLVAKVKRRTTLLRAFLLGGCTQFLGLLIYFTSTLANHGFSEELLKNSLFASGAILFSIGLSFFATILLLPLIEHLFGASSNIRLNDFADLGHILLEKLSLAAPGTFHHSIVVANLSAAAAEQIGANALLARVGAYYHDIGKLTKPNFYTENILHDQKNPHDDISPNMSAVIIAAHVKEGIGLALHYNLPPPIRDIIREHQGTSIMHWFLHKAREEARIKAEESHTEPIPVDESQFRYPGPRPSTKESGIVLLADSIEAASRSLERPTYGAIENLVNNIVSGKIEDEQLDCCPLSFLDIARIKRTFTTTLTNILHARVAYPSDDKNKEPKHAPEHRNPSAQP